MEEFAYTYDPTTTYISPNAEIDENTTYEDFILSDGYCPKVSVEKKKLFDEVYGVFGDKSGIHVNPLSTQINLEDVAWQCSHDERFPNMGTVTVEQLKKGEPMVPRELLYAEPSTNMPGSGKPTTSLDTSTFYFEDGILYDKESGFTYNIKNNTSNDPDAWNYDNRGGGANGDKSDGIPDIYQWENV